MSRKYFEELDKANLLEDDEKIYIYNTAIVELQNAHNGFNNFYNEPSFAERLYKISKNINPVPKTVLQKYVDTVLSCFLGNNYGVSTNAEYYYKQMLENLSPKGIEALLNFCDKLDNMNNNRRKQLTLILNFYDQNSSLLTAKQRLKLKNLTDKYGLCIQKKDD